MRTNRRALLVVAMATAGLVLARAVPLRAIGPTVMMFYGGSLKQPILLTGADAQPFDSMLTRSPVDPRTLENRPFINVALFWGSPSDPAVNGTRVLTDLRPDMAWQHGRLYSPVGNGPAVLVTTQFTKAPQAAPAPVPDRSDSFVSGGPLSPAAAAVLKRLGVLTPAASR